jgi:Phage integrase, N-terminal SAM-like domain
MDDIAAQVSPKTATEYRRTATKHLLPVFGSTRLNEISIPAVKAFETKLKRASYALATVNAYVNVLLILLHRAVDDFDLIGTLPFVLMPFDGTMLLHDVGRKKDLDRREIERCKAGMCRCDMYPTGWVLPSPAARALPATMDSFLNDHGRQLPSLVGSS